MIAALFPSAHYNIDLSVDEAFGKRRAEQQMIDAQPGISCKRISKIIPEGVDGLVGMERTERVGPTLFEQPEIGCARFGSEESVVEPALGLVDVEIGRHHVEVACEHHRLAGGEKFAGMRDQPVEPAKFVVEFRTGLCIAIRQIESADQDAVDGSLDIATVAVVRIAGKTAAGFVDLSDAAENGDAIPALLPLPDRVVAEIADRFVRKFLLRRLQLLEADDIGLRFCEPSQENGEPSPFVRYGAISRASVRISPTL